MTYRKIVEFLFFPIIVVLVGLGVTYIATISENVSKTLVYIQVVTDGFKDHELRIRDLEKQKRNL